MYYRKVSITNEKETQALGGSKIVLANERKKVVKFSTGKCICPEDEATPRLTTGRQQQVTRKSSVWKSEDCSSPISISKKLSKIQTNKQKKGSAPYTVLN